MKALCNIYQSDVDLVPHFISHYISQGIHSFVFAVFDGEKNPMWSYLTQNYIASYSPIKITLHPFHYDGGFDVAKDQDSWNVLRETYLKEGEFYVITDLDEFHTYTCPLWELPKVFDSTNTDYVVGVLTDRISADGTIPMNIDPNVSIWDQFPRWSYLTKNIMRSGADKVIMARQHIMIRDGHHWASGNRLLPDGITHHFKWFGPIEQKCREKLIQFRDVKKYTFSHEQQNLLDHLEKNGGKVSPMVDLHDLPVW